MANPETGPPGEDDDISPNWGEWSPLRALIWTVVAGVFIAVLAGFALSSGAPATGLFGTDGGWNIAHLTGGSSDAPGDETRFATTEAPSANKTTADSSRTWTEYDAVVVFRNDDIQPHYRPETMRKVNNIFVEEDVPVTLGVIPKVGGEHALTQTELCATLRENARTHPGIFEFALHGYTHERRTGFHGGSEFGGLEPAQQRALIANGTEMLTNCVGKRSTTFVAPMDTYDTGTVEALTAANYTVVSGSNWFTREYYNETSMFERGGVIHIPNDGGFVANWTTNEFYDTQTLERRFDWTVADGEVYIQMLHYQDFTTAERREQLRAFIQYIKASGDVRFMTLGELGERTENETLRRTNDGWEVYERTGEAK